MVTSIHARPQGKNIFRSLKGSTIVVCPRCSITLGMVLGAHQVQSMLRTHRCKAVARESVAPSASVPFS